MSARNKRTKGKREKCTGEEGKQWERNSAQCSHWFTRPYPSLLLSPTVRPSFPSLANSGEKVSEGWRDREKWTNEGNVRCALSLRSLPLFTFTLFTSLLLREWTTGTVTIGTQWKEVSGTVGANGPMPGGEIRRRMWGKGNVGRTLTGGWTQRMIREYTVNLVPVLTHFPYFSLSFPSLFPLTIIIGWAFVSPPQPNNNRTSQTAGT